MKSTFSNNYCLMLIMIQGSIKEKRRGPSPEPQQCFSEIVDSQIDNESKKNIIIGSAIVCSCLYVIVLCKRN